MKFLLIIPAVLAVIFLPGVNTALKNNPQTAPARLVQDIFKNNTEGADAVFGIALLDLNTGQEYFFNGDEQFEAASLYKLGLMYTLFYLESKGKLDTDQSDIKASLNKMITVSSNEAALYLIDKYTGWEEITGLMQAKGLKNTDFTSGFFTTPKDIAKLLTFINDPRDISLEARDVMMELLKNQTINDRLSAYLPKGPIVYHKTADLDNVVHDAGIIKDPGRSYILVIMTKDSPGPEKVKQIMAKISLDIYHLMK